MAFRGNIERLTLRNNNYRKVLHTTKNMQLVVMSLNPGEEIGVETHPKTSQFIRVEAGNATVTIGRSTYRLKDGDSVVIPPGSRHNVVSTGRKDLKLYTIYTPPEHPKNTRMRYKSE